jgi:hypothetical protein
MGICDLKTSAEFAVHVLEALAIAASAWWFLYTTQFKPRVQFDLECRFFPLPSADEAYLVEVAFVFENKGFVEHRIYDLSLSIHGLSTKILSPDGLARDPYAFDVVLFPRQSMVPERYEWYFVRPGVRQVITHEVVLTKPGPMVELTAGFTYHRRAGEPHTAQRVFLVDPMLTSSRGGPPGKG